MPQICHCDIEGIERLCLNAVQTTHIASLKTARTFSLTLTIVHNRFTMFCLHYGQLPCKHQTEIAVNK